MDSTNPTTPIAVPTTPSPAPLTPDPAPVILPLPSAPTAAVAPGPMPQGAAPSVSAQRPVPATAKKRRYPLAKSLIRFGQMFGWLLTCGSIGVAAYALYCTQAAARASARFQALSLLASPQAAGVQDALEFLTHEHVSIRGARLTGIRMGHRARLDGLVADGVDFSGARLNGASLDGAQLGNADFTDAELASASMFRLNVLTGLAAASSAMALGTASEGTDNRVMVLPGRYGTTFRRSWLVGAHMEGSDLVGSDFAGANLENASLAGADLRGAAFTGSNLSGTDLSGADLSGEAQSGSISQAQLDAACIRAGDAPKLRAGMRPPARPCPEQGRRIEVSTSVR